MIRTSRQPHTQPRPVMRLASIPWAPCSERDEGAAEPPFPTADIEDPPVRRKAANHRLDNRSVRARESARDAARSRTASVHAGALSVHDWMRRSGRVWGVCICRLDGPTYRPGRPESKPCRALEEEAKSHRRRILRIGQPVFQQEWAANGGYFRFFYFQTHDDATRRTTRDARTVLPIKRR